MPKPEKDEQKKKPTRIPTVGIGASAGGIEALQKFFAAVAPDLGLAYVVVVHLAPDRESELPRILARHTSMAVSQVGDHETAELEPNHVYVIAPDRKLEITDTSVGASRFEQPRGLRAAIDLFFRSLAATHTDGFAVVLSGSGSDGAVGAKAVKEAGGLVLVQDPREAAHSDMPRAAIATGAADVVLPVEQLAKRLAELARNKRHVAALIQPGEAAEAIDETYSTALRKVLELVRTRTGHDFSKYKRSTVLRRLARRIQLTHQASISGYLNYLRGNVEETRALFDDLLITVTSFFRDPEAWAALQGRVITPLVQQFEADEQLRVWVPGCATGEEAYSLAILFQEEFDRRQFRRDLVIFATDVDEGALATAREGLFSAAVAADVSPARLERFFRAEDDHYRVVREIRDRIVFAAHSLLRDPPFSRVHLISCRNLLIYLDRELQEQVLHVFRYACCEGGYVFLGASESAGNELFSTVDKKHRIFAVRSDTRGSLPDLLTAPRGVSRRQEFAQPQAPPRPLAGELHLEILEEIAPPSVVVDERWNVLHVSGSAARFFQQGSGPLARKITELVRSELRDEVHAVLHHAFEETAPQLSQLVAVSFDGTPRRVSVLAQQRPPKEGRTAQALVTFLDAGKATVPEPPAAEPTTELVRSLRDQLRQSESQVDRMREDHYLTTEDLRAANEELQSLNEEYRSTTEELETSKEELQSINEELQTVNQELKIKLEEVSRAQSDIENLMAATDIGMLFLDARLHINRFTPRLADVFNMKTRDLGRPIGDVSHSLDYHGLEEDARSVLASGQPTQRDALSRSGQSYIVRLNPYRTPGSAEPEGVIVSFVDVTALRQAEAVRREAERDLQKELALMQRLHELAVGAAFAADMNAALQSILSAAIEIQGADFGNVQMLDPDAQRLTIVAHRGFGPSFLKSFESVQASDTAACARALRTRKTCSIEDVTVDPGYAPHRAAAAEAGYRAVQSIPLLDRRGEPVGILSTHFREPHRFSEREEQMGDLMARQAADLIVGRRQQEAMARLNEALQKRTEELAAESRNREEFLAALGHELRNPLAAIASSLELVTASDRPTRRALGILRRQSQHMIRLLNDLLDITRISRGKVSLERRVLDLGECARQAVESLRREIEEKDLKLEIDLPDDPVHVEADPDRIAQVFDNLLRNALTSTDEGGITVAIREEAGQARIAIRDTGIGIAPENVASLFDSYHQSDRAKRAGGLGLGLTLVKRLVELHGGQITVHSEGPGTGAEFAFTLPLTEIVAEAPAEPAGTPPSRRVLVIDDQPDIADSFAALLEHLGQEVKVAYGGAAALEVARAQRPEVAFVDLSMPDMDGYELGRHLRREFSTGELVLVALTGHGQRTPGDAVFEHYLLKPATPERVTELLSSLPGR